MQFTKKYHIIYSTYLHKTKFEYNALKYDNIVPPNLQKSMKRFIDANKFTAQEYLRYPENVVVMRCLYNFYINNESKLVNIPQQEMTIFMDDLQNYKNRYKLDLLLIQKDLSAIKDINKIYKLYCTKEISWFTFYYYITLNNHRLNVSFLESMLVKRKIATLYKLSLYFKHFDLNYFQEKNDEIMHIYSLNF